MASHKTSPVKAFIGTIKVTGKTWKFEQKAVNSLGLIWVKVDNSIERVRVIPQYQPDLDKLTGK